VNENIFKRTIMIVNSQVLNFFYWNFLSTSIQQHQIWWNFLKIMWKFHQNLWNFHMISTWISRCNVCWEVCLQSNTVFPQVQIINMLIGDTLKQGGTTFLLLPAALHT